MKTAIKIILLSITSLLSIFVIAMAIGMSVPNFRTRIYNAINVIPESEYTVKANQNEDLNKSIISYQETLAELTNEKENLIQENSTLSTEKVENTQKIQENLQKINELNAKIAELNEKISTLNSQLQNISTQVNGAIVQYMYTQRDIFHANFDDDGTYMYHGSLYESGKEYTYSGEYLLNNELTSYIQNFADTIQKNFDDGWGVSMDTTDVYYVEIGGRYTTLHFNQDTTYLSTTTKVSVEYYYNETSQTFDELQSNLNTNTNYIYSRKFDIQYDDDNKTSSITVVVSIKDVE